ncbi:hypothetical protein ACA910_019069 [Epithemia clementina (nom. ined.)]
MDVLYSLAVAAESSPRLVAEEKKDDEQEIYVAIAATKVAATVGAMNEKPFSFHKEDQEIQEEGLEALWVEDGEDDDDDDYDGDGGDDDDRSSDKNKNRNNSFDEEGGSDKNEINAVPPPSSSSLSPVAPSSLQRSRRNSLRFLPRPGSILTASNNNKNRRKSSVGSRPRVRLLEAGGTGASVPAVIPHHEEKLSPQATEVTDATTSNRSQIDIKTEIMSNTMETQKENKTTKNDDDNDNPSPSPKHTKEPYASRATMVALGDDVSTLGFDDHTEAAEGQEVMVNAAGLTATKCATAASSPMSMSSLDEILDGPTSPPNVKINGNNEIDEIDDKSNEKQAASPKKQRNVSPNKKRSQLSPMKQRQSSPTKQRQSSPTKQRQSSPTKQRSLSLQIVSPTRKRSASPSIRQVTTVLAETTTTTTITATTPSSKPGFFERLASPRRKPPLASPQQMSRSRSVPRGHSYKSVSSNTSPGTSGSVRQPHHSFDDGLVIHERAHRPTATKQRESSPSKTADSITKKRPDLLDASPAPGDFLGTTFPSPGKEGDSSPIGPTDKEHSAVATVVEDNDEEDYNSQSDEMVALRVDDKTTKLIQAALSREVAASVASSDGIKKFARSSSPPRNDNTEKESIGTTATATTFIAAPKGVAAAILLKKSWDSVTSKQSLHDVDAAVMNNRIPSLAIDSYDDDDDDDDNDKYSIQPKPTTCNKNSHKNESYIRHGSVKRNAADPPQKSNTAEEPDKYSVIPVPEGASGPPKASTSDATGQRNHDEAQMESNGAQVESNGKGNKAGQERKKGGGGGGLFASFGRGRKEPPGIKSPERENGELSPVDENKTKPIPIAFALPLEDNHDTNDQASITRTTTNQSSMEEQPPSMKRTTTDKSSTQEQPPSIKRTTTSKSSTEEQPPSIKKTTTSKSPSVEQPPSILRTTINKSSSAKQPPSIIRTTTNKAEQPLSGMEIKAQGLSSPSPERKSPGSFRKISDRSLSHSERPTLSQEKPRSSKLDVVVLNSNHPPSRKRGFFGKSHKDALTPKESTAQNSLKKETMKPKATATSSKLPSKSKDSANTTSNKPASPRKIVNKKSEAQVNSNKTTNKKLEKNQMPGKESEPKPSVTANGESGSSRNFPHLFGRRNRSIGESKKVPTSPSLSINTKKSQSSHNTYIATKVVPEKRPWENIETDSSAIKKEENEEQKQEHQQAKEEQKSTDQHESSASVPAASSPSTVEIMPTAPTANTSFASSTMEQAENTDTSPVNDPVSIEDVDPLILQIRSSLSIGGDEPRRQRLDPMPTGRGRGVLDP